MAGNGDAPVLAGDVAKYIRSVTVQIIKDAQVPEVAEAIVAWQATLSQQQVSAHVDNLKKTHGAVSETDAPRCPRCGGDMVLRTSRKNEKKFFGCCNYPKCRGFIEVE